MDISKEIDDSILKYPSLRYNEEKNELIGELFISKLDSYEIQIDLSPYPQFFPSVFEINERIPKKVDRHIYSDSGSCCFTTRAKAQVLLNTKITNLSLFIKDIVIPYFQNNSYFEINKKYKTDEHSHNGIGVIEGYRDILMSNNDLQLAKLLYSRINGGKLTIRDRCYCGSGIPMKKCSSGQHDRCYRYFKKIDKIVLKEDLSNHFGPYLKAQGLI